MPCPFFIPPIRKMGFCLAPIKGILLRMDIPFWKMQGAKNDFILVDDRDETFPITNTRLIARLCQRPLGIGSDGLILLRSAEMGDLRMLFFNPDGRSAAMCGNGLRCAARLAFDLQFAPDNMIIETDAHLHRAEILGDDAIRIYLPAAKNLHMNIPFEWENEWLSLHSVDTGVPHAVLVVDDVKQVDLPRLGAAIRHAAEFEPHGTNVDFIQLMDSNHLFIRTFERGVEGETEACGTGAVAGAIIAQELGLVSELSTISLRTHGGDTLFVTLDPLTLTGPADYTFTGLITS